MIFLAMDYTHTSDDHRRMSGFASDDDGQVSGFSCALSCADLDPESQSDGFDYHEEQHDS